MGNASENEGLNGLGTGLVSWYLGFWLTVNVFDPSPAMAINTMVAVTCSLGIAVIGLLIIKGQLGGLLQAIGGIAMALGTIPTH